MTLDFKKVLCPVDLSSFSLQGLKLALKMAQASDATLDILHVMHNPFDEIYLTEITQTDPALIDAYATEPQRRAKILRATEEHSEVLLKQFCHASVIEISSSTLTNGFRQKVSNDINQTSFMRLALPHRRPGVFPTHQIR